MEVADRVGNARRAISGKPAHGPPLDVEGGGPRRALCDVAELHLVPATFVGGKARTGEREVDVDRLAASGSPFGDFICATIVGIFGGGGGRGGCGAACICMLSRLGCPRVSNPCGIVLFCARALCFSACCSAFLLTAYQHSCFVLSDESACSPATVAVVAYVYTTVTLVLADVLVAPDVRFHGIAAGHCLQAIWPCDRSCDRLVHVLVFDDVVVVVVAVALPGHVVVVMVALPGRGALSR